MEETEIRAKMGIRTYLFYTRIKQISYHEWVKKLFFLAREDTHLVFLYNHFIWIVVLQQAYYHSFFLFNSAGAVSDKKNAIKPPLNAAAAAIKKGACKPN